jgi:hypothetical protein
MMWMHHTALIPTRRGITKGTVPILMRNTMKRDMKWRKIKWRKMRRKKIGMRRRMRMRMMANNVGRMARERLKIHQLTM